ncbi:MAG: type I DNA topoisomerase, partial [Bacillota bacterium]|nr:type I DNA topoisomerase [Bacillota bacterium]
MSNLVIVESPTKAKTISKFLGSKYSVLATAGHLRDLPKSKMGVNIESDFEPEYINVRGKGDTIKALKNATKKADKVFLATDPDREGEAIAWHLAHILGLQPDAECRVVFREITKDAVKHAVKNPRVIDTKLVDAQQARRVLDRLVGYSISPILWRKVKKGLSAGRVQSVATKLICDREELIRSFIPEEYWTIDLDLLSAQKEKIKFSYYGKDVKKKHVPKTEEEVNAIVDRILKKTAKISGVEEKVRKYSPLPPYTTSTLQQDAANRLGFATKKTMMIAQSLYEGKNIAGLGTVGLITYMRTDSTRISDSAVEAAREFITEKYGKEYVGKGFKDKKQKNAQDAHEAIRPTMEKLTPSEVSTSLTKDELRLYELIWKRFMASQMSESVYRNVTAVAQVEDIVLKASGSIKTFEGFTKLYELDSAKLNPIPNVSEGDVLTVDQAKKEQHFTSPPSRYTEGSLVKEMEEKGIGRPSTYAPTITTILARGYVGKEKKSLYPTELGFLINEIMGDYFTRIIDVDFTANMETDFDRIENGSESWKSIIRHFYSEFEPLLHTADEQLEKQDVTIKTDIDCP